MPRKPRFHLPDIPAHVIQRGNNRQVIFFVEEDYSAYIRWLGEALEKYGCQLHAYVLMTNHVHLLMTPSSKDSISRVMQYVGRHYVPYINYNYGRTGTLWEGRYKSSLIQDSNYLFTCMRYIELNPIRANMVKHPGDYNWSSYSANAYGVRNQYVQPHDLYLRLACDDIERQKIYRSLFSTALEPDQIDEIRKACYTGTPLGNTRFKNEIEAALSIKVGYDQPGRPKKDKVTEKGL